jgi:hypothetical protein
MTRGGIALAVSAPHFLASSAVMAEARLVIGPAATKSKAADISFGLIMANSLPAKGVGIA